MGRVCVGDEKRIWSEGICVCDEALNTLLCGSDSSHEKKRTKCGGIRKKLEEFVVCMTDCACCMTDGRRRQKRYDDPVEYVREVQETQYMFYILYRIKNPCRNKKSRCKHDL